MKYRANGILKFGLLNETRKQKDQASWKKYAAIILDGDLCTYYRWFLQRRYGLTLNQPIRGAHISVINDRADDYLYKLAQEKYDGVSVNFEYEIGPKSDGKHWWLRVISEEIKDIREDTGLKRDPFWGLHISLGLANERNIEHSTYIWNLYKKFGWTGVTK